MRGHASIIETISDQGSTIEEGATGARRGDLMIEEMKADEMLEELMTDEMTTGDLTTEEMTIVDKTVEGKTTDELTIGETLIHVVVREAPVDSLHLERTANRLKDVQDLVTEKAASHPTIVSLQQNAQSHLTVESHLPSVASLLLATENLPQSRSHPNGKVLLHRSHPIHLLKERNQRRVRQRKARSATPAAAQARRHHLPTTRRNIAGKDSKILFNNMFHLKSLNSLGSDVDEKFHEKTEITK